mmetsp:Transcript_49566/g.105335  ORF Transcript_49566/g.105335 Transcript_49566/m.105335 type:complete len:201 (-) Transcript_49566:415-1017(-)
MLVFLNPPNSRYSCKCNIQGAPASLTIRVARRLLAATVVAVRLAERPRGPARGRDVARGRRPHEPAPALVVGQVVVGKREADERVGGGRGRAREVGVAKDLARRGVRGVRALDGPAPQHVVGGGDIVTGLARADVQDAGDVLRRLGRSQAHGQEGEQLRHHVRLDGSRRTSPRRRGRRVWAAAAEHPGCYLDGSHVVSCF